MINDKFKISWCIASYKNLFLFFIISKKNQKIKLFYFLYWNFKNKIIEK